MDQNAYIKSLLGVVLGDHRDSDREEYLKDKGLVHYTTAENALNILKGEVWLRNTRVMNDVGEIHHGAERIRKYLNPNAAQTSPLRRIANALDSAHPGISSETIAQFESNLFNLFHRTHVACLSVHHPKTEENGRLSMWRAYTGTYAGVALVVDPAPFVRPVEDPSFFSVPVSYDTDEEFEAKMSKSADTVESAAGLIATLDRHTVGWYFNYLIRKLATASKHHGFKEEEEWRVMHTRNLDPTNGLEFDVKSVRGIPQLVAKLSLDPHGPNSGQGLTVANILRQVIIGPTNFPYVVAEAIQVAMEAAGVTNAESKIKISKIPLRMEP